nr:DUF4097 family beta strand repeat-containing protein [Streptacidiphilus pinicola]
MSSFRSAGPVDATIHLGAGSAEITVSNQGETSVEVRPSTAGNADDIRVAEATQVKYAGGRLTVRTPLFDLRGSVSLKVSLPQGSRLEADVTAGHLTSTGVLGDCEVRTGTGNVRIAQGNAVRVLTQHGNIDVGRALGQVEVSAGSGHLRIDSVDGNARLTNTNGDTQVGLAAGDVEVQGTNGNITIGRAGACVVATTSSGHVKVREVVRGTIDLRSNLGNLEIGVREGSSAHLDVHTQLGRIHNALEGLDLPDSDLNDVRITGSTNLGDVMVQRAPSGS